MFLTKTERSRVSQIHNVSLFTLRLRRPELSENVSSNVIGLFRGFMGFNYLHVNPQLVDLRGLNIKSTTSGFKYLNPLRQESNQFTYGL